ncbi:MAG: radical SAM protein [Patescibacteria group bacterium]
MFWKKLIGVKADFNHFIYEVTPSCNHDCSYCYNVWKYREYPQGQLLDLRQWQEVTERLMEQTNIGTVSISGGEPTIYPDLVVLIKYLRSKKINVNLLTNGSNIIEDLARELVDLDISIFEIPLVAIDKELHKKLKGRDDYDQVVKGIANLTSLGATVVSVLVATKDNIDQSAEVAELSMVLGCRGMMFNRINPANKKQIALIPSIEQIKSALAKLDIISNKYNFSISCSVPIMPCLIDMKNYKNLSYGYCPAGGKRSYPVIDYLGNVRVCNHSPKILGNILAKDLDDIFSKSEYFQNFKNSFADKCQKCSLVKECKGGCRAAAEVCYGCLTDLDPMARERGSF